MQPTAPLEDARTSPRALLPILILGPVVVLGLPAWGRAETAFGESIEWVLIDSDWAFSGKVVKVETVMGEDRGRYEAATVEVAKTFKGTPADRATFLLRNYNGPAAKGWMDDGVPLMFFLVKRDRAKETKGLPGGFDWLLRDDGNSHSAVLLGKTNRTFPLTVRALTRDFNVLTDPDAILERLDKAARSPGAKDVRGHTLEVPGGTPVFKALYGGSAVMLTVPVDDELEQLGRRWCDSRSQIQRAEGAKILGYFKNDKNIELLNALLQDPGSSIEETSRSVPGRKELQLVSSKRLYPVRRLAYEALTAFGVKVEKPVLEEFLPGADK
jgi:hypothetical protein